MISYQPFVFTFNNLECQYEAAIKQGYRFCTCEEYVHLKKLGNTDRLIVNRVDIDCSVKKARRLGEIFERLKIRASFFIRLHANEYNPFSFENYRIIKQLLHAGHEIGYHSEVIDQSVIWGEPEEICLRRDIDVMNRMLETRISGVASHGGMTGLNNLDFWKDRKPADFGLMYEAYDQTPDFDLFNNSFYISDSEWTQWKCYDHGKLLAGDRRSFGEHILNDHALIYLLIHSDTYFETHFYE